MKNWKKYAFTSASLLALAAGLAACGNLKGNNQKAAESSSSSGDKTVIKMYQIGEIGRASCRERVFRAV